MESLNTDHPDLSPLKELAQEQVLQTTVSSVSKLKNDPKPEGMPTVEQVRQGGQLVQTGVQLSQAVAGKPQKEPVAPTAKTFRNTAPPPPADAIENEPQEVSTQALESIYEQVQWEILLDGKPIQRIFSFELFQSMNDHARFSLRVYHSELEEPRAYRIDQTKDLLGKNLTAILGSHLKNDRVEFAGIITGISFQEANGLNGEVIVSGYSPTILLDSGPHFHSFYNKNLQTIAKEVTGGLAGKLDVSIHPKYTQQLKYVAQYGESSFGFLRRLASWYGEWMYYDGKKLCLGKPDTLPKYKLYYARQIEGLKMDMQVLPMNFSHLSYQSSDDKVLAGQPPKRVDGLNFYADLAVEKSDTVFAQPVKNKPSQRAGTSPSLEHAAKVNKAVAAGSTFTLSGTCKSPYLTPGTKVTIMLGETELGEYLITEVAHQLTIGNQYTSTFKAVAGDIQILPVPVLPAPTCEPELAVVKKNDDPDGQGRVRVQFQWQDGDNMTDWIRVMSPDAGGSGDKVAKNRGFVFIPEVGDLLMIGYKDGNPDAPFVMGSMHHGKIASGGGKGNKTKSLTTRSGSTVTLDDDKGSVHVADQDGNAMTMDGAGNIQVSSKESIVLACGEAFIELKKDGTIVISGSTSVQVGSGSESLLVDGKGKTTALSGTALTVSGKKTVEATSMGSLTVSSQTATDVSSTGKTSVQGALVTLN